MKNKLPSKMDQETAKYLDRKISDKNWFRLELWCAINGHDAPTCPLNVFKGNRK